MNWYCFRSGRKIIPQVFDKLKFFRRTQVKDRDNVFFQPKPLLQCIGICLKLNYNPRWCDMVWPHTRT